MDVSAPSVSGECRSEFSRVREVLEQSLDSGDDCGASVAVVLDGELVVDLWGGWADQARTRPWEENTIVNEFSNTKTMTALAALVLIDRGQLDANERVATYWPEFAANGKGDIRIRHLLSHTSGVAGWDTPVELADIYDLEKSTAMLAAQEPWWEPGTASGYHGMSFGHLIHAVIQRVTGKSLGRFFADEIAAPLGADFHIGLKASEDWRVGEIIPPPVVNFDSEGIQDDVMEGMDTSSPAYKFIVGPPIPPTTSMTLPWRRSEICGSGNGHGNARSTARVQSVLSHGGEIGGVRLLSSAGCDLALREQSHGLDLVLGFPVRWGMGYALPDRSVFPYIPEGRVCFWAGYGGSIVINDFDRRMTVAYVMNQMESSALGDPRGIVGGFRAERLLNATYAALL